MLTGENYPALRHCITGYPHGPQGAHGHLAEGCTSFLVLVFGSSGCSGIGSVRFRFGMWARGSLLLVYIVSDFTVIFSSTQSFSLFRYIIWFFPSTAFLARRAKKAMYAVWLAIDESWRYGDLGNWDISQTCPVRPYVRTYVRDRNLGDTGLDACARHVEKYTVLCKVIL